MDYLDDLMVYVYELIDPRTNIPFYVGKGTGDRHTHHLTESLLSPDEWTNVNKCQTILDILSSGGTIIYAFHQCADESAAYLLETDLIRQYGRVCNGTGVLTNIQPGGKGGAQHSIDVYTRKDGAFVGSYESHREAAVSLCVPESTISEAVSKRSGRTRHYVFAQPTANGTLDGDGFVIYELPSKRLVGVFMTTYDAAATLGVAQSLIHNLITGKQDRIYGRYVSSRVGIEPPAYEIIRSIDVDGAVVDYACIKDASTATAVDRSGILRSCKSCGRYRGGNWYWSKVYL